MREVHVGIVGLGNVGSGTLAILADNADQIALKLGFRAEGRGGLQPLGRVQVDSGGARRRVQDHGLARSGRRIPTWILSPNWWAAPASPREIVDAAIRAIANRW